MHVSQLELRTHSKLVQNGNSDHKSVADDLALGKFTNQKGPYKVCVEKNTQIQLLLQQCTCSGQVLGSSGDNTKSQALEEERKAIGQ